MMMMMMMANEHGSSEALSNGHLPSLAHSNGKIPMVCAFRRRPQQMEDESLFPHIRRVYNKCMYTRHDITPLELEHHIW